MSTFEVVLKNHIDEEGNTFEMPTASLNAGGATIIDFTMVESYVPIGENFAQEVWEYEVDDGERFENGLRESPNVVSYKQLN